MLAGLARLDVDGRSLGFREAREHAARLLGAARANRGEALAAGVMIAPLAAMRAGAVPDRVRRRPRRGRVPAGEQTSPLDLRRDGRPGDVSPRDRDRAAFLDVLLCARDALYLSYIAIEPKSGQPLGPSSVVLELADALAPYLGAPSEPRGAGVDHRAAPAAPVSWAAPRRRRRCRGGARALGRRGAGTRCTRTSGPRGTRSPNEDGSSRWLAHPSQAALRAELALEEAPAAPPAPGRAAAHDLDLRAFLEHPVQAWAQGVLGLDELPDDARSSAATSRST